MTTSVFWYSLIAEGGLIFLLGCVVGAMIKKRW